MRASVAACGRRRGPAWATVSADVVDFRNAGGGTEFTDLATIFDEEVMASLVDDLLAMAENDREGLANV